MQFFKVFLVLFLAAWVSVSAYGEPPLYEREASEPPKKQPTDNINFASELSRKSMPFVSFPRCGAIREAAHTPINIMCSQHCRCNFLGDLSCTESTGQIKEFRQILSTGGPSSRLGVCGKICRCERSSGHKDHYLPGAFPAIRQRSPGGGHESAVHYDMQPIGRSSGTISLDDITRSAAAQFKDVIPTITDCEYVSSYNWLDMKTPTILVPGAPPAWTPPDVSPYLREDSGIYFRDINAAHWPQFPMEPAIRSVFSLHPNFETTEIDLVGCGNTMGNLLKFAEGIDRTFEFRVEVIGNTVFLIRRGTSPQEVIHGIQGYGHTYPEAHTTWDTGLEGSVSYQRLIKYKFGGVTCLLRSESDGYLKDKAPSKGDPPDGHVKISKHSKEGEMSALLQGVQSLSLSEGAFTRGSGLVVKSAGREIPQSSIFDMKTRSRYYRIRMEEMYPRLWLSQIPNLIVAYHNSGRFDKAQPQDLLPEIKQWEAKNQALLRRFNTTIRTLIHMARQSKGHKLQVRRYGIGPLRIEPVSEVSWSALPRDLIAKWAKDPAGSGTQSRGASK